MSTGLTIGGWFASAFLDALVDKVSSYAFQQYGLQSGLRDDLKRLRTSLLKVRAVLVGTEKRQAKEENLTELLKELKDAAFDADDFLSELEYQALKLKVEGGGDQASGFFPSALNFATHLFDNDDDAVTKVREIQERLDTITADLKDVIQVLGDVGGKQQLDIRVRPETSSFVTESVVYGRDEERDWVIKLLLKSGNGSESGNKTVPVLPIVGIGGMGKTTLAQLVFHDPEVVEYYQQRIWICVSDPFDVKRITKEMIEAVSRDRNLDFSNLNQLQMILKEKLMLKRFLLVLDDVWNEDVSKWRSLYAPLMSGVQGSKILVTTRAQKVADIMGGMDPIILKGLSDDSYWSFFKSCAFGCQNSEKDPKLEAIGKKIADRLKGSPLAAKTLGSVLNSYLDEEHWRSIMDSEIWEVEQQGENDILPVLELSYRYLPAHLKQCFAYCSVFPKDYLFDKEILVQMWMAQGFIASQRNKRIEDVGDEYFRDLLCRSFFQQHSYLNNRYVMHDLLHDLAQSISRDECLSIELYGESQNIPSTLRHLSIFFSKPGLCKLDWCKYKKLRTLVLKFGYKSNFGYAVLDDLFRELTSIRMLDIRWFGMEELPDSIRNLKQLRYLHISNSNIQRLPESLCSLYNLQVLKVKQSNSVSFPEGMKNLINLRQLDANKNSVSQISEIGRLTSLQELRLFKIEKQCGRMISELRDMTELRGSLCITNLENVDGKEEANQAKLNNKKYLNELFLEWDSNRHADLGIDVIDADVLEGLQPHPNLKKLKIRSYGGVRIPSWLDTQLLPYQLETIHFMDCRSFEQLPSLGQLPFLKVLKFESMHAVRQVGHEFYGTTECKGFPSLEELVFEDMPEWEEWLAAEASQLFPCLRKLCLKNCPKLRRLPCLPPSLTELDLYKVGLNALPSLGQCPFLKVLRFESIHAVKQVNHDFYGTTECKGFPSLVYLKFVDMPEWEEWCVKEASSQLFPCLHQLYLANCPKLTSLEELFGAEASQLFPCLHDLHLENCPKLRRLLCLPPSLTNLNLYKMELNALSGAWVGSDGQITNNTMSQGSNIRSASLSVVDIKECPNLTSLEEWLFQPAIMRMSIINCGELASLPVGRFKDLPRLEYLEMRDCPKLTSAMQVEDINLLLPSSLRELVLGCCGDFDKSMHCCLQNLTSLKDLKMIGCPHITSLPREVLHLTALQDLTIQDSAELISLFTDGEDQEGLLKLTSLRSLDFNGCPNLQSLPLELSAVSTLLFLGIYNCPELKSLPENGLPGSLKSFHLKNCHPDLKERCREDTGPDWPKIAHVLSMYLDG